MAEDVIKIRERGVITIPQSIREAAELNVGDHWIVTADKNQIIMTKADIQKAK